MNPRNCIQSFWLVSAFWEERVFSFNHISKWIFFISKRARKTDVENSMDCRFIWVIEGHLERLMVYPGTVSPHRELFWFPQEALQGLQWWHGAGLTTGFSCMSSLMFLLKLAPSVVKDSLSHMDFCLSTVHLMLPLTLFFRWEQRELPNGRVYYVDHNTKTTTWERPLPPG